jgi:hypothetical protein
VEGDKEEVSASAWKDIKSGRSAGIEPFPASSAFLFVAIGACLRHKIPNH